MSEPSGHAPLVWFTSLAIGGAGMIAASAWHLPSALAWGGLGTAVGALVLGAGVLVSTLHLGRKSRAPFAVRGLGRSALSLEVVLAAATGIAGLALLMVFQEAQREALIRLAAGAIAILFLLSIGRVYRLGAQRTWRGASVLLPLTTGLVCGDVFLRATGDAGFNEASLAFWLIPIDAIVFVLRWRMLLQTASAVTSRGVGASRVHRLCATRLFTFDGLPLVLLSINGASPMLEAAAATLAFVAVAVGLVFDRWLFYELADQHTTESEIDRVEAIIERTSGIN